MKPYKVTFVKILVLFIFLLYSDNLFANWKCEKPNSENTKCSASITDKSSVDLLGAKIFFNYTGKSRNGLPYGKGSMTVNNVKANNNYEESLKEEVIFIKSAKGFFKTKGNGISVVDGEIIYKSNVKVIRKNSEPVKVIYPNGQIFSGVFYKDKLSGYPRIKKGQFEYLNRKDNGPIKFKGEFFYEKHKNQAVNVFKNGKALHKDGSSYEGTYVLDKDRFTSFFDKGTYIYPDKTKFVGSFAKNGSFISGTFYYANGDSFKGSFSPSSGKNFRKTGTYYYADGGTLKYSNGKQGEYKAPKAKKVKTKTKTYSESNFFVDFIMSWVFTGILWGVIIAYFYLLGTLGKISSKIDKKIKGTKTIAGIIGFGLTWYLGWSILYGFEAALIINFTFLYLGAWGAMTMFLFKPFQNLINGKYGVAIFIGYIVLSLGLAIESIGPFVKFLKSLV